MNTLKLTQKLALLFCLALLGACGNGGGGGEGGSSSSAVDPASLYTFTKENFERINTTVTHAPGDELTISNITFVLDSSAFSYGSSVSLSSYVLDNGSRTFAVDTSALSSTNLVALSANAANQRVWVGGTTWGYSRFGYFVDKTPNSNLLNTQYLLRNLPYTRYQRYFSAAATNATYAAAGSKAIGTYVTEDTQTAIVTCNISVAFTATGVGQSSADFTLSGCDNGITPTGYFRAAKSSVDTTSLSSIGTFGATSPGGVFTPTSASIHYGLGGPNSEEIVGSALIYGTTLVGAVTRQTRISFAFGAKK